MNKKRAFKESKEVFPLLKPTRLSSLTSLGNHEGVLLAGFDEHVAMVVYDSRDLMLIKSLIERVLEEREKK